MAEPANLNAQENFPKSRMHGISTPFDVSPEIGHTFVAPIHEALFEQYNTQHSRYFPFVPTPPEVSTFTMMKERPFLYTCCVMTASHRDPPLQARIARDILKYLCEHMILAGEKSLDLLQGLLVMTAWYHVYTHNNPQLMNLLHLAKALLIDLGLNRAPGFSIFQMKMSSDATAMIHGNDHESQKHNLEERRACLGLYHVCSRFSAAFRRVDSMPWTEHLEECCQVLQEAAKYPSDAYAVALIRLDHLLERYTGIEGFKPGVSMPIQTYVKLFSDDIDRLKQSLPDLLRSCPLMLVEILNTEVCLFEPIVGADCDVPVHKVEAYHACLRKVMAFFEAFNHQEVTTIPHQPFLSWITIAHALDILARLSFAQVEGWDLGYVRNTPGFCAVTDQMTAMLQSVQAHEKRTYPTSRSIKFKIFSTRAEKFRQWYDSKIQQEQAAKAAREEQNAADSGLLLDSVESLPVMSDFSDMLWQDFNIDWSRLDSDFNFT